MNSRMVSGNLPEMRVILQIPIITKVPSLYLPAGKSFFSLPATGRKDQEDVTLYYSEKKGDQWTIPFNLGPAC